MTTFDDLWRAWRALPVASAAAPPGLRRCLANHRRRVASAILAETVAGRVADAPAAGRLSAVEVLRAARRRRDVAAYRRLSAALDRLDARPQGGRP